MEGISVELVKLIVCPKRQCALAVVQFRESTEAVPAAWSAVMRLRVSLTVTDEDSIRTLRERACAAAVAYFDEDCS